MFKKRYEPHIRGDKVTIIDKRTAVMYPLMYGIVTMYVLIIWGIGSFSDDMKLNAIILAGVYLGVTAMCICFERKYVIEPESISVFYGIIGKKLNLHKVTHCFRNSNRHISLSDDREREVTIDLAHLPDGAEKYFLESLRNTNVNIRNIGYFVEHEGGANYNYKFKMCQREAKVGKIAILLICLPTSISVSSSSCLQKLLWEPHCCGLWHTAVLLIPYVLTENLLSLEDGLKRRRESA